MTARSDYASAEISWLTSAVWQSKLLFSFVFASLFCAVAVIVLYVTPMYEGTTLLFVNHSSVTQRPQEAKNDLQEDGSLAQMAESEEVLTEAISRVGLTALNASVEQPGPSKVEALRRWLLPDLYHADPALGPMQAALVPVHKSLNVRVEPNSDIIRISFRNRDPAVAARFANAVAQAFIERQIAIFDNPGAADFFKRRKTEFETSFRNLSDELTSYAVANSAYSIDDQRQLLLKTQNELAMALNTTRNQLADRQAQRQVLSSELRRLAPVARSSYVSSLVDALGGPAQQVKEQDRSSVEERTSDPPLLLVRVYQDTMATLFKINSDVTATRSVEAEQEKQIAAVGAQLDSLQKHEKRFSELRTAVSQASYNVEFYTRKMVEEQVRSELARERFSPLKLLQAATVSTRPVFPNYWLALAFALIASSAGATVAAVAWHAHRERRVPRQPGSSQLLPSPI